MQRRLCTTLAVVAATGALALGAGTAFADSTPLGLGLLGGSNSPSSSDSNNGSADSDSGTDGNGNATGTDGADGDSGSDGGADGADGKSATSYGVTGHGTDAAKKSDSDSSDSGSSSDN
jgi:hypothetical protein